MLDCIRQLQLTVQQHVLTNSKKAEYHMSQNTDLFTEMARGQKRRDLDPAIMAIPTFTGQEPEKCLDWINRIKNICSQTGHSLRQELMNKSEPVVQNFIGTMGDTWTDEEVIEEILKYFSDIPTPAHAITKLRALIQGEEEAIVTYNQKYRTLVERVERWSVLFVTPTPNGTWAVEAFWLCVLFLSNLREVPHGTKGTGPRFVTRPVYLRSQLRNNTNTVLL